MITVEYVKKLFLYYPETGEIYWNISKPGIKYNKAGYINKSGYLIICIDGVRYRAHRIIWLYMTNEWPENEIDHKNLDRSDNRWINLRKATKSQNMMNGSKRKDNTSGYKGVSFDKTCNKWRARINLNKKEFLLGYFNNKEDAAKAYRNASKEKFKEFANPDGSYSRVDMQ